MGEPHFVYESYHIDNPNQKPNSAWEFLRSHENQGGFTIFTDIPGEGIIYSLSIRKYRDGNDDDNNTDYHDYHNSQWHYTFQEEGLAYGYHHVCYGKFELDIDSERVISQTLHDKYDDCFHPNFAGMMGCFFNNVSTSDNFIPKQTIE